MFLGWPLYTLDACSHTNSLYIAQRTMMHFNDMSRCMITVLVDKSRRSAGVNLIASTSQTNPISTPGTISYVVVFTSKTDLLLLVDGDSSGTDVDEQEQSSNNC